MTGMCFLQLIKDLPCFINAQPRIISSVLDFKPAVAKTSPAQGSCTSSMQLEADRKDQATPREGVMAINICYTYSLTSGMKNELSMLVSGAAFAGSFAFFGFFCMLPKHYGK